MFKALVLQKEDTFSAQILDKDESELTHGDVLVKVDYSTLNFKDGLAITNKGPVVRTWPMIAGIDGAGTVVQSTHPKWKEGDRVVHNGWGVGETQWGCLAQMAQLKGDGLIALPANITTRQAMAIGTAGYTAMLCVMALDAHFEREGWKAGDGEIVISGATGGVGSVAVALLAKAGHRVVALTGKADAHDYLKKLGAETVLDRAEFSAAGKPFQKERWMGAVDTAGSLTLANICAQTRYRGAIAACGLAQGADFPSTAMPFILRNVSLLGIDSVMTPVAIREKAWQRLSTDLDLGLLDTMIEEVTLSQSIDKAAQLMAGQVTGRVVVNVNA